MSHLRHAEKLRRLPAREISRRVEFVPRALGVLGVAAHLPHERQRVNALEHRAAHAEIVGGIVNIHRLREDRVRAGQQRGIPVRLVAGRVRRDLRLQPRETFRRRQDPRTPRGQRVQQRRLRRLRRVDARLHEVVAIDHLPIGAAGRFPCDGEMIVARSLHVTQLDVVALPRCERACAGNLRGKLHPLAKRRGRWHRRDLHLVGRRFIRAEKQRHDIITRHREGVTTAHLRHQKARHARAVSARPVGVIRFESRDEIAGLRPVRIIHMAGQIADGRARHVIPNLLEQRARLRVHGGGGKPRLRNHLPRLTRAGPLELRQRVDRALHHLEADVHLAPRGQLRRSAHVQTAGHVFRPRRDKLVINPQPRAIIRRDIERVGLRELRIDLPRPPHGKVVPARQRRARWNARAPVKIHRRIRARGDQRSEVGSVVIFPREAARGINAKRGEHEQRDQQYQ